MSSSVSIRFPSIVENQAAGLGSAPAEALLVRLGRSVASIRRRRAERRVVLTLQAIGHPGLIADYQQAILRR
jgi:hypothetical protein